MTVPSQKTKGRCFKLSDGRNLEFSEYGDPRGEPIIFFHGLIGSHDQDTRFANREIQDRRIITVSRPGVGKSDPKNNRSFLDMPKDIEELLDALSIDLVSVYAVSGGAPYALACTYSIPHRIRNTVLVNPFGPLNLTSNLKYPSWIRTLLLKIFLVSDLGTKAIISLWGYMMSWHPERFFSFLLSGCSSEERSIFSQQRYRDLLFRDFREACGDRNDTKNLALEFTMYRDWGFALANLPVDKTVTIWHGLDDTIVPHAMSIEMAKCIPNSKIHLMPGGHFVLSDFLERVMLNGQQAASY